MSGRNRFPFTATQWQELEHQALIFKYMISGMPIPPDLLFTIKRSFDSLSLSSKLFSHQSKHFGWNCFQVGLGKKVDPEPGRCRRTDGKKWRCSKEAYPDSKYCERHMHRGKNRSRKPVENLSSPPVATKTHAFSSPSSDHHLSYTQQPFLYSHRPPQHNTTNNLLMYSQSQSHSSDYRSGYGTYGLKEEVDEHAFFSSEPSSGSLKDSWQLSPLTMNSSSSSTSKQRSCSDHLQSDYPNLQLQSLQAHDHSEEEHCYGQEQPQKTTVHRFFDEWPPKNRDSWLDLEDKTSNSATRLSISIPTSSLDFPNFNSRTHCDG